MNVGPTRHISFSILFLVFHLMLSEKIQAQTFAVPEWEQPVQLPAWEGKDHPGLAGPLTGFHAGVLVVAGGANFPDGYPWQGGTKRYHQNIYTWEPGGDNSNSCFTRQQILLPEPMAYAACVSTSQGIVCAGGENAKGFSNQVYLLRWQQKSRKLQVSILPSLPLAISNAMLAELDGHLYLAGGETASGTSDNLYSFSWQDTAAGWKKIGQLPEPVSNGIWLAEKTANPGQLWLIGGRAKQPDGITAFSDRVYAYDISAAKWQRKASLPYPFAAGTGIVHDNNMILIFGGDKGLIYNQTEELILKEKMADSQEEKQRVKQTKDKLQQTHPGFSRELLGYDITANQWKKLGELPFATPVTTSAIVDQNRIYIPSGEIRAGVRSPMLRIGKMPSTHE